MYSCFSNLEDARPIPSSPRVCELHPSTIDSIAYSTIRKRFFPFFWFCFVSLGIVSSLLLFLLLFLLFLFLFLLLLFFLAGGLLVRAVAVGFLGALGGGGRFLLRGRRSGDEGPSSGRFSLARERRRLGLAVVLVGGQKVLGGLLVGLPVLVQLALLDHGLLALGQTWKPT